jgi:hypothetical protein
MSLRPCSSSYPDTHFPLCFQRRNGSNCICRNRIISLISSGMCWALGNFFERFRSNISKFGSFLLEFKLAKNKFLRIPHLRYVWTRGILFLCFLASTNSITLITRSLDLLTPYNSHCSWKVWRNYLLLADACRVRRISLVWSLILLLGNTNPCNRDHLTPNVGAALSGYSIKIITRLSG